MAENEPAKKEEEDKPFDPFELIVAILLGLGAIGGAWAGFQSGLWGGNQATAYAEAGNLMSEAAAIVTEAATQSNDATMTANRDADIDLQVKRAIFEAEESKDPEALKRAREIGKWFYAEQLSDEAKKFIGFPNKENSEEVTDAELDAALTKELGEKYFDALYAPSLAEYEAAEKKQGEAKSKFYEGQVANYNGDLLSLTGVLYTIAMFLAGVALVFKSKVRWGFAGVAFIAVVGSTIHLVRNPWTKLEAPEPAPPSAASAAPSAAPAPSSSAQ